MEKSFMDVARMALSGHFKDADAALAHIDQVNSETRYKLLVALFRKELWNLQYTVQGGGGQFSRGDLELSRLKETISAEELDNTIAAISASFVDPQDQLDAADASRLLDLFYVCDLSKVNLRIAKLQGNNSLPGVTLPSLSTIRSYCDAGNLQWPESILPSVDRALLRYSLLAPLDASAGDTTSARSDLENGLATAKTARRQAGVFYFLLSLGDLFVSREGDIHTLGYDLATDTTARTIRQYDPNGGKTSVPIAPADVDAAEAKYADAQTVARSIPGLKDNHEFALRTAYIAFVRGQPSAAALYLAASLSAVKEDAVRMAALYQATYALIETSPAVFSDAVKSLMENNDAGGIVSCAEMARGYASRSAFNGNLDIASADLRIAIASLDPNHFYHAEADLQDELARIYGAVFQSDLALTTALDDVRNRNAFISEAQACAHFDQGLVDSEKESEGVAVNFLVDELTFRASTEDGAVWSQLQSHFNKLMPELNRTLNVPAYQDFELRQLPAIQHKMAIMSSEQNWFTHALNCESFLSQYPQYETAAKTLNDPDYLLRIQLPAALCDSTRMQKFKTLVGHLTPVENLERAVTAAANIPPIDAQRSLLTMKVVLQTDFTLADKTRQYDLMANWADALAQLISRKPGLAEFSLMAFGYKAHALIGLGRPQDAISMLDGVRNDALQWNRLSRPDRIAVLHDLTRAEMLTGDFESSIAALESAKVEEDKEEEFRSGVRIEDKETAEIAMLRRQYIQQGGNIPAVRLTRLSEGDARTASKQHPSPDQLESKTDVRNSIELLPAGSSLLMYSVWDDTISLLQVSKTGVVNHSQSPCDLYDVSRGIQQLRQNVADPLPGWEDLAHHLYDCLLPTGLKLPSGSALIVSLPKELFGFPFEILAAPGHADLFHEHAVLYARFLSNHAAADDSRPEIAKQKSRLVVGVNGPTLSNAEDEAIEVGKLLHVSPLLGSAASQTAVSKAMVGAQIIHLTTHASINSSNPYLSYLALRGGEEIQAWQIFQHALNADLVFLSACDTDVESGSNAFNFTSSGSAVGLSAFFQGTNVGWTVASLWKADDRSTKDIVTDFYTLLNKGETNPAVALQKSKISVASRPESAHPYFYAPLIVSIRYAVDINHSVNTM
jgi:CHAT domain-containing protein